MGHLLLRVMTRRPSYTFRSNPASQIRRRRGIDALLDRKDPLAALLLAGAVPRGSQQRGSGGGRRGFSSPGHP